ncbi:hypothetical protein BH09BAC5_BH09BAC5_11660 [soil metagenome]
METNRIAYKDSSAVVVVKNFVTGKQNSYKIPFDTKYVSSSYSGKFHNNKLQIEDEEGENKFTIQFDNDF